MQHGSNWLPTYENRWDTCGSKSLPCKCKFKKPMETIRSAGDDSVARILTLKVDILGNGIALYTLSSHKGQEKVNAVQVPISPTLAVKLYDQPAIACDNVMEGFMPLVVDLCVSHVDKSLSTSGAEHVYNDSTSTRKRTNRYKSYVHNFQPERLATNFWLNNSNKKRTSF